MITLDKINKKSKDYRITAVSNSKNYAFIIDGSIPLNNQDAKLKWYISDLKWALKKHLFLNNPKMALEKATKQIENKYKNYFKTLPKLDIAIYKKENNHLQIFLTNGAKCYIKEKESTLLQTNYQITKDKIIKTKDKKDLIELYQKKETLYIEKPYDKIISIILCNEGFYNYNKYLELKPNDFYKIVERNGVKNCYNHLKRIEEKDKQKKELPRLNTKDDVVAIYKMLL